jgi:tetrahydromethanopterin S-methyltransferase subunit E
MRMLRFYIRTLLVLVLLMGVGLAAVIHGSYIASAWFARMEAEKQLRG